MFLMLGWVATNALRVSAEDLLWILPVYQYTECMQFDEGTSILLLDHIHFSQNVLKNDHLLNSEIGDIGLILQNIQLKHF